MEVTQPQRSAKRSLDRGDLTLPDAYAPVRKEKRAQLLAIKRPRRVEVGPVATCYFECFETMVHQINEMLYIERGGEEQIEDELRAYAGMVPNGRELVVTVMFEIDDPVRRHAFLAKLGGIEETMFLRFGDHEIVGKPEEDVDRTTADGKASSVQFIHFPFTDAQAAALKTPDQDLVIGFSHPQYGHMVKVQEATRASLAADLD
ncbi:DUF3501 family protein [Marivibrio halodurans]|uniref:DUF3501 family protein n=1 Tax=Marivibrio halodurans TaxID=2039722 RepID=A0A8J7S0I6_9PROT|nr:DUF3501 family protein [Marivibrio halodurans]MBP5858080.1 DUF3501 family protein [Marivibrio halodurans]